MKVSRSVLVIAWVGIVAQALAANPVDRYNVIWDSPSQNHHGSMPIGNGDLAANVWMTDRGELHLYISKTDAWDDNARLVKVGKVRLLLEPNPLSQGESFHQELVLSRGAIEFALGRDARTRVRVWVDANHPAIYITAESALPLQATACLDMWRTNQQELADLQVSDVMTHGKGPDGKPATMLLEPDTVLAGQSGRIGWFHHNRKSVGPAIMAEIQGLDGFQQPDPLLHRIFGGLVTAKGGERLDDYRLRSPAGQSHRFTILVQTRHPATPEQWIEGITSSLKKVESVSFKKRLRAHAAWWEDFWERSWIRATASTRVAPQPAGIVPTNGHPVCAGWDQAKQNRFVGELGRISVFTKPLSASAITALAAGDATLQVNDQPGLAFSGHRLELGAISGLEALDTSLGLTIEAWVKPGNLPGSGARLVDKITPGGSDGFLLDTFPGNSLRFICGGLQLEQKAALSAGVWTHVAAVADTAAGGCRLYLNGKLVADNSSPTVADEAAYVSQAYQLQRYITACAGRGAFPIKFNGSLFTVPPGPTEADPDYRRWGPGYWWQNTRLPYISLCAAGDFDLQQPLFGMYAHDLLPLCKYRTEHYLGHGGAFYPECIMFWGPVFSETYGWTPFAQRTDKLQESGWHKWEWVGGLELCWMMLDYFDHTRDQRFLKQTVWPFAREILTFFQLHYPTNADGQLVFYPSQALETWWRCTNATPEVAGCIAVADRFLASPTGLLDATDHAWLRRFRIQLPPVPVRQVGGKTALAPAEFFAQKSNIENPELYPVFPFRLFAFNRPNADWAVQALRNRWDKGHSGWRQDDIFMAYLGLTEEARSALVSRAKTYDRGERFPAFWGPNYDWTPDQDHGGVLMKAFQSMLLQTDGDQIYLFPAWPKEWNVDFKLHAPQQTVVEGSFKDGKLGSLRVTPKSRRADLMVIQQAFER